MARKKTGGESGPSDGAELPLSDVTDEIPTDPGTPVASPDADTAFLTDENNEPTRPGAYVASFDHEGLTEGTGSADLVGAVPWAVDPAGDATGPLDAAAEEETPAEGTFGIELPVDPIQSASPSLEAALENPPEDVLEFGAEIETGERGQVLDLARAREEAAAAEAGSAGSENPDEEGEVGRVPFEQLEALIEALLFASDKPVGVAELKRLTGERDTRLINQALDALVERRKDNGLTVVTVAGAYSLRTNPKFADWVSKLVAGKPVRLSRAMLETLAIVAYRQPITRPEIDDVRGVDCGPVLKTLLDRNLVRIIGKSEEVGRPMLYGTTSEFLRIFSLKDLTQLPTLRQFHELSAEHQAKVDEAHPAPVANNEAETPSLVGVAATVEPLASPGTAPDPGEDDRLMAELEEASEAANRAAGPLTPETPPADSQDT